MLLVEDDIIFSTYFWPLLNGLVFAIERKTQNYILLPYTPMATSAWPAFVPGVVYYPVDVYYGTQAIYFPFWTNKRFRPYLLSQVDAVAASHFVFAPSLSFLPREICRQ